MFGRWLFVRLRAAENALAQGRIDEAYEIAAAADVRADRRGQRLADELVRPLTARARLHAQAGRFAEASADLEKLARLGRLDAEGEALRARVEAEARQRAGRAAERMDAVARASAELAAGRLESGRAAVQRVEDARQRELLQEQLDLRVERSRERMAQARAALERGDVIAAIRTWHEACTRHGRTSEADEVALRLATNFRELADDLFAAGRLDGLGAALQAAAALVEAQPALGEYERMRALSGEAAQAMMSGDFTGAREALLRLVALRGNVRWVCDALETLGQLIAAQEKLLVSPLSHLVGGTPVARAAAQDAFAPPREASRPTALLNDEAIELGEQPLRLLVDAAGSALLVARDTVRVGRAGSERALDVALPADVQSHHADIVRAGDDYFLVAHGPASVNHRPARRALLRDGDRIMLGARTRLVFQKPSVKSASALLRLADRCRLAEDVSVVLLFKDTCIIGPQPTCHVQTREGDNRVVLFERGGRLFARRTAADGRALENALPVPAGRMVPVGDQRITIKPAAEPGGRAV